MSTSNLEDRVATLEAEVAQLKTLLLKRNNNSIPWWDKIITFENSDAFEEAMQLGREYRQSQKPVLPEDSEN